MAKVDAAINTMAGVVELDDKGGTVSVVLEDGGNVATLTVVDGQGNTATVYVGWQQTSMLMANLGAAAYHM